VKKVYNKRERRKYQKEYKERNAERVKLIEERSTLRRSLRLIHNDDGLTEVEKNIAEEVIKKAIKNREETQ